MTKSVWPRSLSSAAAVAGDEDLDDGGRHAVDEGFDGGVELVEEIGGVRGRSLRLRLSLGRREVGVAGEYEDSGDECQQKKRRASFVRAALGVGVMRRGVHAVFPFETCR